MSAASDEAERLLRMELMQTDIANKRADTAYKKRLTDLEGWKLALGGILAGAGAMGAIIGLLTFILHHA